MLRMGSFDQTTKLVLPMWEVGTRNALREMSKLHQHYIQNRM